MEKIITMVLSCSQDVLKPNFKEIFAVEGARVMDLAHVSQVTVSGFCSHQFYVRELLGDSEGVVADRQHVSLDGRLGLRFESRQPLGCRGVDLDQRLLVLTEHRQPPDQALAHLADRLSVNLVERCRKNIRRL